MVDSTPLNLVNLQQPLVVIPMAKWDRITEKALRFGLLLSKEIKVVHVHSEDEPNTMQRAGRRWSRGRCGPKGCRSRSWWRFRRSFRLIIAPLMDYILKLEQEHPDRKVAVLLPELVVKHWWEYALHGQRVQLLKLLLLLKGNQRVVVVNIPWYL